MKLAKQLTSDAKFETEARIGLTLSSLEIQARSASESVTNHDESSLAFASGLYCHGHIDPR